MGDPTGCPTPSPWPRPLSSWNHLRFPLLPQPCGKKVMGSGTRLAFPFAVSRHPEWQVLGSSQQGWHLSQSDLPPHLREGPGLTSRLLLLGVGSRGRSAGIWAQLRQANLHAAGQAPTEATVWRAPGKLLAFLYCCGQSEVVTFLQEPPRKWEELTSLHFPSSCDPPYFLVRDGALALPPPCSWCPP